MSQRTIRVGFIGAGENTRKFHIPKLQAIPGVTLAEVANRTLASGERVARGYNIQRVRSSWQDLLTSTNVDAVVIGTWPYLHCAATCTALKNEKHVLCEARMAMNLSEAKEMQKVSKAHPNLISQLVPAPLTLHLDKTIRTYIEQGRLGKILFFHADYQSNPKKNHNNTLHWRRNKKYSGENTMVLGIIYESVQRWLPSAIKISAFGKIYNKCLIDPATKDKVFTEIPDYLSVQMEMDNGIYGSLIISEVGLHASSPTISIYGTEGSLKIEFIPNGKLWYGSRINDHVEEVKVPPKDKGYWRVEDEFINAIRGEEKIQLTTFDSGVDYMRFTQAVMDSYREGGKNKFL